MVILFPKAAYIIMRGDYLWDSRKMLSNNESVIIGFRTDGYLSLEMINAFGRRISSLYTNCSIHCIQD